MPDPDYLGFAQMLNTSATSAGTQRQQAYQANQDQYADYAKRMASNSVAAGDYTGAAAAFGQAGDAVNAQAAALRAQVQQGLTAASQGDVATARNIGAQTGDPATYGQLQDAAATTAAQRGAAVARTADLLASIKAAPGENDASLQQRRARALQTIQGSGMYSQTGTSPEAVNGFLQGPLDDNHLALVSQALTPLWSGKLGENETAVVNGRTAAQGVVKPVALNPDQRAAAPANVAGVAPGSVLTPAAPLPIATPPGTVLKDPVTGAPIGGQTQYPLTVTPDTVHGGSPYLTNTNVGPSGAPGAAQPTPGGAGPSSTSTGPSQSPVSAAITSPQGAPMSGRGPRNNNPGNIRPSPTGTWQGQTGVDPQGYAIFDNAQDGARAMDLNLQAYQGDGAVTPRQIAMRWASTSPPAQQAAYIARIAQAAGVSPDTPLNLSDPAVRARIDPAIMASEGTSGMAAAIQGTQAGGASAPTPTSPVSGAPAPGQSVQAVPGRGYAPTTQYGLKGMQAPSGDFTPTAGANITPTDQLKYASDFINTPQYKDYDQLTRFHYTAQAALNRGGGPADLQLIDMAIKANNPTLGARPNQVEQAVEEIGPLNRWAGQIKAVVNNGQQLSPPARQAMANVVDDARAASWHSLQPLLQKADRDAQRFGLAREDLVPGVIPMDAPAPASSGFGSSPTQLPQGGQGQAAPAPATQAPAIQLAADPPTALRQYASLPSGATYRAPDGSERRKK